MWGYMSKGWQEEIVFTAVVRELNSGAAIWEICLYNLQILFDVAICGP